MLFVYKNKSYLGKTAVKILRAIEHDSADYPNKYGSIREFLVWSMERMSDRLPPRELDVSPKVSDENLAFDFLCLLDNYKLGKLFAGQVTHK